jgi:hypothetical protein
MTNAIRSDGIIVDLDGTLAIHQDRSPFDWGLVHTDLPNTPVVSVVRAMAAAGYSIVYCSGRDSVCREATETWINEHVGVDGPLYMRARGDNRKDAVVKKELYENHIEPTYRIAFVLDDRDQVVELWRNELGLTCFQVAPGSF